MLLSQRRTRSSVLVYGLLWVGALIVLYPFFYMAVSYTHLDVYKRQVSDDDETFGRSYW